MFFFFSVSDSQTVPLHLRLSQLVVVMGEPEIEPAAVDVHGLSEDGASHG